MDTHTELIQSLYIAVINNNAIVWDISEANTRITNNYDCYVLL